VSKEPSSPLATSVHQRLLTLSGKQGADFNLILIRYGAERLLYRLSKPPHAMDFVLKGAMLLLPGLDGHIDQPRTSTCLDSATLLHNGWLSYFRRFAAKRLNRTGWSLMPKAFKWQ